MTESRAAGRTAVMTTLAVLFGLLALSNFSKPFTQAADPGGNAGFVFFGQRLHGVANAVVGPVFGVILATYAYGVWTRRRWVVPIAIAYAAYVVVNLALFAVDPPPGPPTAPAFLFAYALVAIGVSTGAAVHLRRNRERLR